MKHGAWNQRGYKIKVCRYECPTLALLKGSGESDLRWFRVVVALVFGRLRCRVRAVKPEHEAFARVVT